MSLKPSSSTPLKFDSDKAITTYIQNRLDLYRAKDVRGDPLWERWVEDFEDWDVDLFSKVDSELRREFRDYLISRGIYMTPNPKGKYTDQQLATDVKRDDFHGWTPEQIAFYQKKNPLGVSSRCDPKDPSYKEYERTIQAALDYERTKGNIYREIKEENRDVPEKEKEEETYSNPKSHGNKGDKYKGSSYERDNCSLKFAPKQQP